MSPSVVPSTAPEKALYPYNTNEFSDNISMNLFEGVALAATEDPTPFLLPSWGMYVTVLYLWRTVGIMEIFLISPALSVVMM